MKNKKKVVGTKCVKKVCVLGLGGNVPGKGGGEMGGSEDQMCHETQVVGTQPQYERHLRWCSVSVLLCTTVLKAHFFGSMCTTYTVEMKMTAPPKNKKGQNTALQDSKSNI